MHAAYPLPPTPVANVPTPELIKLAMHAMANLYRAYVPEDETNPDPIFQQRTRHLKAQAATKAFARITTKLEGAHIILAVPHRVADVTHTILWKLPRAAEFTPEGNLAIQVAFQPEKPTPPEWQTALLSLTATVSLQG